MKSLNQYIKEKLIINKDYRDNVIVVKSFDELRKIIEDRYDKFGAGTKHNPIDFNDIDVSNLDSFYDKNIGLFEYTKFKYIDVTYWNVSNAKSMRRMFFECDKLKSGGDLSKWDISKLTDMYSMFYDCKSFNQDISKWDVSKVSNMSHMFTWCESFNQDLSNWNVSKVKRRAYIFEKCPIKDEYKPKFK